MDIRLSQPKTEYTQNKSMPRDTVHLAQYVPFSSNGLKLQNVCRICLLNIDGPKVSLLSLNNEISLKNMLQAFTSVQIFDMYPVNSLPSYLCEICKFDVIHCYEFKVKCETSDSILRSLSDKQTLLKKESFDIVCEEENELKVANCYIKDEVKEETVFEDIEVEYLEDLNEFPSDNEVMCIVQTSDIEKVEITTTDPENLLENFGAPKENHDKQHTCNFCSKKYSRYKSLKAHIVKNHRSDEFSHPCGLCKEVFCSEHDLEVHSAVHAAGPVWNCNKCNKDFKERSQLRRHVQRHMQAKRFSCGGCGKAFCELYALRRHARVHTGEAREKKFACQLCDKRYYEKNQLRVHEARHRGERRCVCATCGKAFPSPRLLASHRLVHSDAKPYACSYCDKRFRHESTRNTHHRTHTGEKPYVCAACGKTFIQNSNLTLHMRTHTGEKPHACDKCDQKFATRSTLKHHRWRHTGEKPFSCTVCGKRFARQDMKIHMRQHTGERPFACTVCSKKFVCASRLRDHCRMHTGEKPFECDTCSQKCSTKSHLINHLKKHQAKRKCNKKEVVVEKINNNKSVLLDNNVISLQHSAGESVPTTVEHEVSNINSVAEVKNKITFEITPEVPVEELVVQSDCDVKEILVVDNSLGEANYQSGQICINSDGVNYVNSDVNSVTVNEGTTLKLYQLDQSLVQIHSSGGQVTISKITSKMTANF